MILSVWLKWCQVRYFYGLFCCYRWNNRKRWVRNQMRNKSLDAVKAIAACLVVCIHVSFPGQAGQLVKVLARCAVPFFFMVSGYFCYYQNCNASKRILSKILHIMKLFAVSVVFYFIWECFMKAWNGERVWGLSFSEPLVGFEPTTPRLQITCSGQLS